MLSFLTDFEDARSVSEQSPHGVNGQTPLLRDLSRREMLFPFNLICRAVGRYRSRLNSSPVLSPHALLVSGQRSGISRWLEVDFRFHSLSLYILPDLRFEKFLRLGIRSDAEL